MAVNKFQGETNWDAVVNDNGLDIEKEESFRQWLRQHGFTIGDEYHIDPKFTLEELDAACAMWRFETEN